MPLCLMDNSPRASNPIPAPGGIDQDIAKVSLNWQAIRADIDSIDTGAFETIRGGVSYITLASSGPIYTVSSDIGMFPEESITVRMNAQTVHGGRGSFAWGFSTRVGMAAGVIGDLRVNGGTSGVRNIAHLLILPALCAQSHNLSLLVGVAGNAGSIAHTTPLGLGATSITIEVLAMTLGDGTSDFMKMRLTIKKDFLDLLALHSVAIGEPDEETGSGSIAIQGYTGSNATRSIRVASEATAIGSLNCIEIEYDNFYQVLRSAGVGDEDIQEVMRAIETSGGQTILIEIDLIDEILNEGR